MTKVSQVGSIPMHFRFLCVSLSTTGPMATPAGTTVNFQQYCQLNESDALATLATDIW